ncbi:MAG: helix-turn-helix domain-containing protein [Ignavibacteriaceae bacterium]|jgi:transcriptional regulator with XRE-family HTH domain|nr:helix-turn-helix domain-containing protein [Ignavibacteriaceae bacterium]MCW8812598.1 helix-turn-helix domain-containing protein [Chlorobium sp.]MCW8818379.1 helix-turn-helix domain-containing protein [Ignavibacteriaceae bacterium]MCW8822931.1 helix-turn-helix domain-containing protein [Ignavibacteriaceae bacterium]MCW9096167.1 helix-turn-helix domain-containing protein [Ignavibacteriaceae bacterium]
MSSFGEYIKNKRLELDLSLRKFCELVGLDPSNWSKIERGKLPAPEDREKLDQIATVLKIKKGSKNWQQLFDLASIAKKKIPDYVYKDKDVISALPVFFRTAHGDKPTEEELQKIIDLLKGR